MATSPSLAKNIIRRCLWNLISPSPSAKAKKEIWKFFDSRCAYCDRLLSETSRIGHIDHLVPLASLDRAIQSQFILACASCNSDNKRDMNWKTYLECICKGDQNVFLRRSSRIQEWIEQTNEKRSTVISPEMVFAFDLACMEISRNLDMHVDIIRKLVASASDAICDEQGAGKDFCCDSENALECNCSCPPAEFPKTWENINRIVQHCVDSVFLNDEFLLVNGANERALAHRLGVYLAAAFRGWQVDCEYNRIGANKQSKYQPKDELCAYITPDFCEANDFLLAQGERAKRELLGQQGDDQPISADRLTYPDLVVHKRGCLLHNLLVIEIKTEGTPKWQTIIDLAKLHSFTLEPEAIGFSEPRKYPRYTFGLFLEFAAKELKSASLFQSGIAVELDPSSLAVETPIHD